VYIRSFADANGDGIGDLEGIRQRLDYLSWLGVDAVWITPFFPSPGFDHGYDVSDFAGVDPIHGDLADFDTLVATAHELGLRVVIDIVPNHSSSFHPWFLEAKKSRDNPYRDFYIWKDPASDGRPPNNWVSHFGGPAWTLDEASGQYYCHLFLPEQPDLNWDNEEVRSHFDHILRFWCDRGVDGFRVDVAHAVTKDPEFRDNPLIRPLRPGMTNWEVFYSFDHRYDVDQDRTVEVFRRWNKVVEPYGAMLIGEVAIAHPERIARYSRDGDGLNSAFFLEPPRMDWDPAALLAQARAMHAADPDGVSWVTDNHDRSRSVTRFGGGATGARRSLALTTLFFGLGGTPFVYQGQELGIGDGAIAAGNLADPIAVRNVGAEGRDGTRTAMSWEPGPGNGFTSGEPWLPADTRPAEETVAGQRDDPASWLTRYRDLIALRHRHPDFWEAPAEWLATGAADVAAVHRGSLVVVANLGDTEAGVPLPDGLWQIAFASAGIARVREGLVVAPAEASLVLESAGRP
jgi:alpha-glucosidase